MGNTDSTKITFPEFYCKRCKSQKGPEDFSIKKNDKVYKTCKTCIQQKKKIYGKLGRSPRIERPKREIEAPTIFGGDPKYLELLKRPMSELCDDC